MYNLYSALSSTSLNYGITLLKVFYDTLMVGVKCKDSGINNSYYGHVLFDKINYDYSEYPLQSNKSIVLNLGLINSDIVQFTGNQIVDTYFDQNNKTVTLFTISSLETSFVPKIYKYNINNHDIAMQYPVENELPTWLDSSLGTLTTAHPPCLSITDDVADILITTITDEFKVLNLLTFNLVTTPKLINYSKYSVALDDSSVIKKIQRVDNEIQFYSSYDQNITPFKIVDK